MHPLRAALLAFPFLLASCTADSGTEEAASPDGDVPSFEVVEPSKFAPGGPISDAQLADYHVALTCAIDDEQVGAMTVDLWTESAPITARNFLRLCDVGFYDGLTFHRVVRSFMVQGGDPTGSGMGNSPFGTIEAEFSDAPERAHGYGVLSMARMGRDPNSASCQFFIICDESPNVWNLDGDYASFGRITSGVATLEALADVPTKVRNGENSAPTKEVTIVRAEVRDGAAPTGEKIERPRPPLDLNGEPAKVTIQHVLVSFDGAGTTATRTKEDAATLAREVLERARAGEDFEALVLEYSDDPVRAGDPTPGVYHLLNVGVLDIESARGMFQLDQRVQAQLQELQARVRAGELTSEEFTAQRLELVAEAMVEADELSWAPRENMVPSFGDVSFSLAVGEVGMTEYDPDGSKFGWHVIRRLE